MKYVKDKSDLWHTPRYYLDEDHELPPLPTVFDVIKVVVANHPSPCWFWFNDTPAPIFERDTQEDLYARWSEWRGAYQERILPKTLLDCLQAMAFS